MCNLKKFYWEQYNNFLGYKVRRLFRKYDFPKAPGQIVPFRGIDWKKKQSGEWGSAPSYTNSVYHPDNVIFSPEGTVKIITERATTIGYDWNGILQARDYASGMMMGPEETILPGRFFEVVVNSTKMGPGYWPCFLWLFRTEGNAKNVCRQRKVDWPFSSLVYKDPKIQYVQGTRAEDFHVPYFEVDAGEMFIHDTNDLKKVTMSTHWGYSDQRRMFNSTNYFDFDEVPQMLVCIQIIFTGETIDIYYNGVLMYRAPFGCPRPMGERVVPIISDAVLKGKDFPPATMYNWFQVISYQTGVLE